MNENHGEIVLYRSEDGNIKVDVLMRDETVWLTQSQMGLLFGKGRTTITEHIQNIFTEGELDEQVVCRKFRHTTQHGAEFEKYRSSQKMLEREQNLQEIEQDIKRLSGNKEEKK